MSTFIAIWLVIIVVKLLGGFKGLDWGAILLLPLLRWVLILLGLAIIIAVFYFVGVYIIIPNPDFFNVKF